MPTPPLLYFMGGCALTELKPLLTLEAALLLRLRSVNSNVSALLWESSSSSVSESGSNFSFLSDSSSEDESSLMMSLPSGAVLKPRSLSAFFLSSSACGFSPGFVAGRELKINILFVNYRTKKKKKNYRALNRVSNSTFKREQLS